LKPLTVFAITESLSSIFHLDTTRWEKKYFLISLLHRHLTSFNECPRVLPVVSIWNISVNGISEKPWTSPDGTAVDVCHLYGSVIWLFVSCLYHSFTTCDRSKSVMVNISNIVCSTDTTLLIYIHDIYTGVCNRTGPMWVDLATR